MVEPSGHRYRFGVREIPLNVIRGFFMGAADIVPGVSGGTVALVFGIYRRLVGSIRHGSTAMGRLLKGDISGAKDALGSVDWLFLIPLGAGVGTALLSLASLIERLLEDHPEAMAGLFTGLVLGSVVVAWGLLEVRDLTRLGVGAAVGLAVFVLLGLRGGTSEEAVTQLSDPALWAYFAAGSVAICAMILPGISGSFILVMLGMYAPVLGAVSDRDLLPVALVGLGAVVGLALFSQVLHWSLEHHYNTVMAALIGLMVGSLRVLWPWPEGVDSTNLGAPDEAVGTSIALAVVGLVVVVAVDLISQRVGGPDHDEEVEALIS
jgi:putative membrane protein